MNFKYKQEKTFEQREGEFQRISRKYPDKIPVICEKDEKSKLNKIEKTKYLIEKALNLTQFSSIIRKKLDIIDEKNALFFLVNGKITISGSVTMADIYKRYKDKDGFLYIAYSSEETWGNKIFS